MNELTDFADEPRPSKIESEAFVNSKERDSPSADDLVSGVRVLFDVE